MKVDFCNFHCCYYFYYYYYYYYYHYFCRRGGLIKQRHNELRDLNADMPRMVCNDAEIEPVLQELTVEWLPSGTDRAPDARLDIQARGFWGRQRSAIFDVRVC